MRSFITTNPVASGSPTTYQAPAQIPPGNTVTLTATSVTDNAKSASTTVTITQPTAPLADGTYVFQLSGTDFTEALGESNYHVVGAFTFSGGLIVKANRTSLTITTSRARHSTPAAVA